MPDQHPDFIITMNFYSYLLLFSVALLFATGCSDSDTNSDESESATSITTATAQTRDLSETFSVSGEVMTYRRSYVASRIEGLVFDVRFEEGDDLSQGDIMARIDVRQQQAELRRAEAIRTEAETHLQRTRQLVEAGSDAQAELQRAERDFEQADSEVERLRLSVEFGDIKSPMNGVVTSRLVEIGNNVAQNERLFTVEDTDLLVVRPGVSELNLAGIEAGDEVEITLDVYPDRTFAGHIRRIFPTSDSQTRLFTVEVELHQSEDKPVVRPGYLARVQFAADRREEVIAVPSEAIEERDGNTYVFVLNDDEDRVRMTEVETGARRDGFAEILSGIEAGTKVAAANLDVLEDDSLVRVAGTFRRFGFRE